MSSRNGHGPLDTRDPLKVPVDPRPLNLLVTEHVDYGEKGYVRVIPRRRAAKTTQATVTAELCPGGHARPTKFGNCPRCGAKLTEA